MPEGHIVNFRPNSLFLKANSWTINTKPRETNVPRGFVLFTIEP